jgi:hypothetical protein
MLTGFTCDIKIASSNGTLVTVNAVLTATPGNNIPIGSWSGINNANLTTVVVNISSLVTSFNVTATTIDSFGVTLVQFAVINIAFIVNASFILTNSRSGTTDIETGEIITMRLFAITTGTIVPFQVDFGDGSTTVTYTLTDESVFINYAYAYAGNYTVTVTGVGVNITTPIFLKFNATGEWKNK